MIGSGDTSFTYQAKKLASLRNWLVLFAGTVSTIPVLHAQNWTPLGLPNGTFESIRFSDKYVYASCGRLGLYRRSRNLKENWEFLGLRDTSAIGLGVQDVYVDEGQENIILAAIYDRSPGGIGIKK